MTTQINDNQNIKDFFHNEFIQADKLMITLLFVQWFVATLISSISYETYMLGFISGGLITLMPLLLFPYYKGTRTLRLVIATSMMLFSALYIQQHLGRIEMHFHIFVGIAILTYYKDTAPVYVATSVTIVYHALFNYLQSNNVTIGDMPIMVFNYTCGWDVVLLHAFFALVEGVILAYLVKKQTQHTVELVEARGEAQELSNEVTIEHTKNLELMGQMTQFQRALEDNSIVSRTNKEGIITYANERFEDLSGYSVSELVGSPHNIVRHPDTPKSVFKDLWETIKEKKVFKATIKNKHKNGNSYYVNATVFPILDENGEVCEYMAVRTDISELVRTKKALEAEQSKERFIANMNHELRTPLNAIIGFINLTLKEKITNKAKDYLHVALASSDQLLYLLNDILDLAKIKSDNFSLDIKEFNVEESFNKLTSSFQNSFIEKEIYFKFDFDKSQNCYLEGDWHRISQIVSNLLSNAIKFTPQGGTITLYVEYNQGMLVCKVKDNGIGLNEDAKNRIFNAFEQADSSTTREYGGTGLGLNISSKLANIMGGSLTVQSTKGIGSTFTLEIPLNVKESILIEEKSAPDENLELKFKAHVLVAEDNKTNQMLIKLMLDDLGISCDVANDGVEAVEMYKPDVYDLVIMDENMPIMSGIEAMKKIHGKYDSVVPIIALTANTMKGDRERFIKEGMDDYIPKPVDNSVLISVLKKYLKVVN